eukprot:2389367-Pleurochrysis_carterae.AAC.1
MTRDAEYTAFQDKLKTLRAAADTAMGTQDLSTFMSKQKKHHRGTRPGPIAASPSRLRGLSGGSWT